MTMSIRALVPPGVQSFTVAIPEWFFDIYVD
jgi:hypothetical protein